MVSRLRLKGWIRKTVRIVLIVAEDVEGEAVAIARTRNCRSGPDYRWISGTQKKRVKLTLAIVMALH